RFAAARGFVDAVIRPEHTRDVLALALRTALHNPGPHLGPWGELGEAGAARPAYGAIEDEGLTSTESK
ncbi:MAG TPA: hypothetical protein VKZ65_12005, partial [Glycomyces sp.]|nr:hypothetical protein [Glycomyces sp.]